MTSFYTVAVIRHNTNLRGDLDLAIRESEALTNQTMVLIDTREELHGLLGRLHVAMIPVLRGGDRAIAFAWHALDIRAINRLLHCASFVQEVFVLPREQSDLARLKRLCAAPCDTITTLCGSIFVTLSWNYIIESEGVLDSPRLDGRIQDTVDLLLEPYRTSRVSAESRRLRKARKTTLSLSHDLHVYKAKFFPRMVRALLNIFGSSQDAQIVDPYCGSGTALLEAALLGFDSVGVDIDPVCQLISAAKVTPFLQPRETRVALDAFEEALGRFAHSRRDFRIPDELARKIKRRDVKYGTRYLQEIDGDAARVAGAIRSISRSGVDTVMPRVLASDAVTKKVRYRFIGVGNGKYAIEILKQPILSRVLEKTRRARQLCYVFDDLRHQYGLGIGSVRVADGDACRLDTWRLSDPADVIITSPPYLPASSGREHYSAARALSFAVLGMEHGRSGYFNMDSTDVGPALGLAYFEESRKLMDYLMSDESKDADPQRDAMRFRRKAGPTRQYLADMTSFFASASSALAPSGRLLLVVANQHTFYSHRRQRLEHVVSGPALYSELAEPSGLGLSEVITMELLKSSVTNARPRASEDYFESVLVSKLTGPARS